MHILRKQTLPDRLGKHQRGNPSPLGTSRASSDIVETVRTTGLDESDKENSKGERGWERRRSSQVGYSEVEKAIIHNRYTLNLLQNHRQDRLPAIVSLKKAQKLLIPSCAFEHYKQVQSCHGTYQQALSCALKQQQRKQRKLMMATIQPPKSKVKKLSIQQSRSQKLTFPSLQRPKPLISIRRQVSFGLEQNRWQLRDFFDPIVEVASMTEQKSRNLRQRASILEKLQTISNQCARMESDTRLQKSVQVFAHLSEQMDSKLVRKQRKLSKVNVCQQ